MGAFFRRVFISRLWILNAWNRNWSMKEIFLLRFLWCLHSSRYRRRFEEYNIFKGEKSINAMLTSTQIFQWVKSLQRLEKLKVCDATVKSTFDACPSPAFRFFEKFTFDLYSQMVFVGCFFRSKTYTLVDKIYNKQKVLAFVFHICTYRIWKAVSVK
jgi:hypothetical protein